MRISSLRPTFVVSVVGLLLAACGGAAPSNSASGEYPSKPIRLMVPFAPGGSSDATARAYAVFMSKDLGQPVVVENKPGGSGALAMNQLVKAKPDGYTLALITAGTMVLTPLSNKVGYTKDDITTLGGLSSVPYILAVGKDSPYKSAKDFMKYAKENPGALKIGVTGAASPQAIELKRLNEEYGIKVTVVPTNGDSEMTAALLGKNIDGFFATAADVIIANIESGSFRALAISPKERVDWLPNVPTLTELGYVELNTVSTYGLAGPSGLPEEVTKTLENTLRKAHGDKSVNKQVGEKFMTKDFQDAKALKQVLDETQRIYGPIFRP